MTFNLMFFLGGLRMRRLARLVLLAAIVATALFVSGKPVVAQFIIF